MALNFWGAEVKTGQKFKVSPADGLVLHISQANVGELKKEKGDRTTVCLFVNVNGQKLVLGTLFTDKLPQQKFDLVFDQDFELSHNFKGGSVYFYGYWAFNHDNNFSSEEEDESKAKEQKGAEGSNASKERKSGASKGKAMIPESDNGSSDENLISEDDDEDDSEDSDDESDESEEEEETPYKAETSKKRPVGSALKTPVPEKKAKASPQRTDGKKSSVHVDTPYPSKLPRKTPANKPNQQTPKSDGLHSCKSCKKAFGSEKGLESHSKAKHGGGK